jgi:dTDP-4-amino-4,6-dideoxygalactose transaminase
MIPVTKPFLPAIEEYLPYLRQIWERNWLTNNGPLVNELELRLKEHLSLNHLLFLTNGTIALQIAIKALGLSGEIITTPFTYIATTSAIVWEGCEPVFVDIEESTLNIDASKIEAAITPRTSAIIATHTYGNPCDIDAIQQLAEKHSLKVIYDASHCFGTMYKGRSVYGFGDVSTASFHATKVFHTVEGGAVITPYPELLKKMAYMRNFGHNGPDDFAELGINGKNSEVHAAMGLVNLKHIAANLETRKRVFKDYQNWMKYLKVRQIRFNDQSEFNYAYFPVIFETHERVQQAIEMLNGHLIYPRRYFHPPLNRLRYVRFQETPISDSIASRVLCLPFYNAISTEEIDFICRLLLRIQNN